MNVLAIASLLEATLRASTELSALMQLSISEKRDVTDEEVKNLKLGNDLLSQVLIQRLQG